MSPLVLLILDGWGYCEDKSHNAIAAAHTPQWDTWWDTKPHMLLDASGCTVGLPDTQMGNSEVGHMHIGAGRIIPQDLTRINEAIATGDFFNNPAFIETLSDLKKTGKALHVLGLLSPGGVHSHEDHLFAFLALCAKQAFNNVKLHLFLDGRDTPPKSALESVARLQQQLLSHPVAEICSVTGRYYAMDRDQRWQRVEPVYRLLTEQSTAHQFVSPEKAIESFYQENIEDEFIPPSKISKGAAICDGDAILFFNFRADRARQLTHAFLSDNFTSFVRPLRPKISHFLSMTPYADYLPTRSVFPTLNLHNTLGEIISKQGLKQLRIAETEKYAHVTFFFNGGSEKIFPGEKRILIPSPQVATYDLQPEMSAPTLTKTLVESIKNKDYDVIICNFANADMVGHSGNFTATIQAIESLDKSMHDIGEALNQVGGQLLITADHGNAESMYDDHIQQAHTAHTNNPVPLLYVGGKYHFNATHGSLTDIAPTILALLNITIPKEMSGHVLLVKDDEH